MRGTVVQIIPEKGFFFLRVGNIPPDFFAHKDDLPKGMRIEHLEIGQEFEFAPITTAKGPRASELAPVQRDLDSLINSNG